MITTRTTTILSRTFTTTSMSDHTDWRRPWVKDRLDWSSWVSIVCQERRSQSRSSTERSSHSLSWRRLVLPIHCVVMFMVLLVVNGVYSLAMDST